MVQSVKKWMGWRGALCVALLWSMGCAEGAITPPATCSVDEECGEGQRCDVSDQVCREALAAEDMGGSTPDDLGGAEDMPVERDDSVVDAGDPEDMKQIIVPDLGSDEGTGEEDSGGGEEDMGDEVEDMPPPDPCLDVTCAPRDDVCESEDFLLTYGAGVCVDGMCTYAEQRVDCTVMDNRKCESGACVDRECDPACEAPGTCTAGTCAFPSCMVEGDACDASAGTTQGSFLCLIDTPTNDAHCYASCPAAGSDNGCGVGQRCFAAVENSSDLLICLDSECSTDVDCAGGTCVKFENSFGFCEPGGAVAPGGTCNPGASQWCQQGAVCLTEGAAQGTCESTCDPWAASSGCGASNYCELYSTRTGVCTGVVDPTGANPYDACTTAGNLCDDITPCFPNGGTNVCIKLCRPNSADCSGIGSNVACDEYFFAGNSAYGICHGVGCTMDTDCASASTDCVGGLCRQRCTAGNEVMDCGSADWTCVGGYCE